MEVLMQTLLLLGALAVGGLFLYAVFAQSWRMLHSDGRLRLRRMLARNGVPMAAADASDYEMACATRRCVACADKPQCDAWLAARKREGFEAFCPNADLIARCARR
jgi:hypothetical protein